MEQDANYFTKLEMKMAELESRVKSLEYELQYKKDVEPEQWVYGVDY